MSDSARLLPEASRPSVDPGGADGWLRPFAGDDLATALQQVVDLGAAAGLRLAFEGVAEAPAPTGPQLPARLPLDATGTWLGWLRTDADGPPARAVATACSFGIERLRLRQEREALAAVLDQMPGAVLVTDRRGRVEHANAIVAARARRPLSELVGMAYTDLLAGQPIDDTTGVPVLPEQMPTWRVLQGQVDVGRIVRYQDPVAGEPRWFALHARAVRDAGGGLHSVVSTSHDVTALKRAEADLRLARDRFEAILRNVADAVLVIDAQGRIEFANDAMQRALSPTDPESPPTLHTLSDLLHAFELRDERGQPFDAAGTPLTLALHGIPTQSQVVQVIERRTGVAAWYVLNASPVVRQGRVELVVMTGHDITVRRQTEAALQRSEDQLRQAQKLEAIGRLAGGVAHDFNNLLTGIIGYTELVLATMSRRDTMYSHVEQVRKAADRAAELTRQLLAFGRKQLVAPRVLDLHAVVHDMERLLSRLIGEPIRLELDLHAHAPKVCMDPGQIEQVIMNLSLNARDAMPRGGRLTIGTRDMRIGPGHAFGSATAVPGDYVRLSVTDTGSGIDDETLAHLFEPFYSTKGTGQGTGLGLSTVYGIVQQNRGYIRVSTQLGTGTQFELLLPKAGSGAEPARSVRPVTALPRGRETVLLVEDESGVRTLAAQLLQGLGYTVHTAASAEEALALFEASGADVDLLLTDVVMPGLNGRELADRLRRRKPQLGVLYMSGYTDDLLLQAGVQAATASLLPKPFSPAALAQEVRRVLDADRPRPTPRPEARA